MLKVVKNICVVGDAGTHKKSLLLKHTTGISPDGTKGLALHKSKLLPDEWRSSVLQTYISNVQAGYKDVEMWFSVICGLDVYEGVRILSYPGSHAIILCFSITVAESLKHVENKWLPEIKDNCPDTPIILVGTEKDMRDRKMLEDGVNVVSEDEGKAMAKTIGAFAYVECSATTGEGIKYLFQLIAELTMQMEDLKGYIDESDDDD